MTVVDHEVSLIGLPAGGVFLIYLGNVSMHTLMWLQRIEGNCA